MIVKLLTIHHLEFLSLKGDCRGSFESTLVKMSNCWKSHALAQLIDGKERNKKECKKKRNTYPYLSYLSFKIEVQLLLPADITLHMGLVARKPVLGVSGKARLKPASPATETS